MDSYKSLPPEIEAKVSLLRQHRATIEHLSQECNRLESEVAHYLSSVSPIRGCPTEILLEIFQHYLNDNPRLIRRLIVCKSWYSIIIETAWLWTNIPIVIDTSEDNAKDVVESILPRIKACVRYSKDQPLHIDLDMAYLHSISSFIRTQEEILHSRICKGIVLNEQLVFNNAANTPWNPNHVNALLSQLVGNTGNVIQRWGTFKFVLPLEDSDNEEFMDPIWAAFAYPTPQLAELCVYSYSDYSLSRRIFPHLPSLKKLSLTGRPMLWLLPPKYRLEHLTISIFNHYFYSRAMLHEITSLRSLEIRNEYGAFSPSQPNIAPLRLPRLKTLAFTGGFGFPQDIPLHLPSLVHLRIERSKPDVSTQLPIVSPKSITWSIVESYRGYWTCQMKRDALRLVLKQYSTIETLTVFRFEEKSLDTVVRVMKEKGTLPLLLKQLRIVSDEDENCLLRVDDLSERSLLFNRLNV